MKRAQIETYTKFRIEPEHKDMFRDRVSAFAAALNSTTPDQILRYDWFVHPDLPEAAAIALFSSSDAYQIHLNNERGHYEGLREISTSQTDLLHDRDMRPNQNSDFASQRLFEFTEGLQANAMAPTSAEANGSDPIEIFTRFVIQPDKARQFRSCARQVLDIVNEQDPGTLRYDWYYDDDSQCLAMDTYADPDAMFAHMKNCAAKHHELLDYSVMTTEFLGELPEDVMAVVAKYDPYILHFYCGIERSKS